CKNEFNSQLSREFHTYQTYQTCSQVCAIPPIIIHGTEIALERQCPTMEKLTISNILDEHHSEVTPWRNSSHALRRKSSIPFSCDGLSTALRSKSLLSRLQRLLRTQLMES